MASTQLTDLDTSTIGAAISDLNNLCETENFTPRTLGLLKCIADNLAGVLPVQTMAHTRWEDKKHTLRQATYVDPDSGNTKDVIMLFFEKKIGYITILDLNNHIVHSCEPENLIPQKKQYTI